VVPVQELSAAVVVVAGAAAAAVVVGAPVVVVGCALLPVPLSPHAAAISENVASTAKSHTNRFDLRSIKLFPPGFLIPGQAHGPAGDSQAVLSNRNTKQ